MTAEVRDIAEKLMWDAYYDLLAAKEGNDEARRKAAQFRFDRLHARVYRNKGKVRDLNFLGV